jgi:hypothetical protein
LDQELDEITRQAHAWHVARAEADAFAAGFLRGFVLGAFLVGVGAIAYLAFLSG